MTQKSAEDKNVLIVWSYRKNQSSPDTGPISAPRCCNSSSAFFPSPLRAPCRSPAMRMRTISEKMRECRLSFWIFTRRIPMWTALYRMAFIKERETFILDCLVRNLLIKLPVERIKVRQIPVRYQHPIVWSYDMWEMENCLPQSVYACFGICVQQLCCPEI